jgi:O-acetyl-ADP-ribose deacetylase
MAPRLTPVAVSALPTLRQLYASGALAPSHSPRHPPNAALTDRVTIWQGDITRLQADAIVNAANTCVADCGRRPLKRNGTLSRVQ